MKISVQKVPASGESTTNEVDVEPTGASVGEVLEKAKVSTKDMKITINGHPVDEDTHVAAGATIAVTEKPRGS